MRWLATKQTRDAEHARRLLTLCLTTACICIRFHARSAKNRLDPKQSFSPALKQDIFSTLPNISMLLLVLAGIAVMFSARSRLRTLLTLAALTAIVAGLPPATKNALIHTVAQLPIWLTLLVAGFVLLGLLGAIARLFIGKAAADSMVGDLAAGMVRALLLPYLLPYRFIRRLIRRYTHTD